MTVQPPHLAEDQPVRVYAIRHYGRWASLVTLGVLAAMLVHFALTTTGLEWPVVGHYLFASSILHGVLSTVDLTVLSMAVGVVLGTILAVMRLSPNPILRAVSALYVGLLRSVPVLVQLLFWYYMAAVVPYISLGVPFGPKFGTFSTRAVVGQLTAAVLGLGLNEAAYMGEIIRAGIRSVDSGQVRAAESLGMSRMRTMRRIVLPQALRLIIPPTGNEVISVLKGTSICIVIAYAELLTSVQLIYSSTFQTIPLLTVACIWYIAITTMLTMVQVRIERRFAGGSRSEVNHRNRLTRQNVLLRGRLGKDGAAAAEGELL
jgi:polar amino acid transport system permease protein